MDSAIEKSDISPSAATRMDLEGIVLGEISQTEKGQILHDFARTRTLENEINEHAKQKQRDKHGEHFSGRRTGEAGQGLGSTNWQ